MLEDPQFCIHSVCQQASDFALVACERVVVLGFSDVHLAHHISLQNTEMVTVKRLRSFATRGSYHAG